ncbi:MAG: methyltransferase domain-containing protein [Desulfobaccales bacterium]|nr:methyltransferase domain-containing protein [Desulfobaccales bacterium]
MTVQFVLEPFDPCPLSRQGLLDGGTASTTDLMALDIQCKYLFLDEEGQVYHQYSLPTNADIHNCAGYVDKVVKYRDPALLHHFQTHGVKLASLQSDAFPILASRSPQLDLILFDLIRHLRINLGLKRVSLFDLGCTVAEHWDLLDVMLQAASAGKDHAAAVLSYCGLDKSVMLLTIARLLHHELAPEHFRLIKADGSRFVIADQEFDLSLSVGVINHVAAPLLALEKIIRATRYASVLALWVTLEDQGFSAIVHSGLPFYFFSKKDILSFQALHPEGRFYLLNFIPESDNPQERSFIGIGQERIKQLGCYHLVYTTLAQPPFAADLLQP